MPISGVIIDYFGWPWVFYSFGIMTLVWLVFWYWLMHDTPRSHPRISSDELQYIENSVNTEASKNKVKTISAILIHFYVIKKILIYKKLSLSLVHKNFDFCLLA